MSLTTAVALSLQGSPSNKRKLDAADASSIIAKKPRTDAVHQEAGGEKSLWPYRFLEPSSLVPSPATSPWISRSSSPDLDEVPSSQIDEIELTFHTDPHLPTCICSTLHPLFKASQALNGKQEVAEGVRADEVTQAAASLPATKLGQLFTVGFTEEDCDRESIPSPVKAFQALFDFNDDEGSYPPDFPESLR